MFQVCIRTGRPANATPRPSQLREQTRELYMPLRYDHVGGRREEGQEKQMHIAGHWLPIDGRDKQHSRRDSSTTGLASRHQQETNLNIAECAKGIIAYTSASC